MPIKIIHAKAMNDKPWMTAAVKEVIKKRRRGYKNYKLHPCISAVAELEKLNVTYKGAITTAKREYFDKLSDGMRLSSKEFRKYLKKTRKENVGIPNILYLGEVIEESYKKIKLF